MPNHSDEFYIGYEDKMPPGLARRVRGAVLLGAVGCLAVVAVVLAAQQRLAEARYEFGQPRTHVGFVTIEPYPRLTTLEHGRAQQYWLVAPGKQGADQLLAAWDGQWVRLEGALIERDARRMLDVVPASIASIDSPPAQLPRPTPEMLGHVKLRGEIVDGKCFLGVMNPAEGAVHRDCAVACLRGGLPPMLRVTDGARRDMLVVLASTAGRSAAHALAGLSGRPIEVSGDLYRDGPDYVLRADPSQYAIQ
jgi:hypothetical protein